MRHSRLAASAAGRWVRCPGSIAYIEYLRKEKKIPDDRFSGDAAKLGTAVHAILEYCIINSVHPETLTKKVIKKIVNSDKETTGIKITEKEIAGASVGYNRVELIRPEFDEIIAEHKYNLSFVYNMDVGGTCDISGFKENGLLGIEDYKNGRAVVEAVDNYQTKIYALGAYHNENEWYNFQNVRSAIIQPNASHRDGRIRVDEYTIDDLRRWEEKKLIPAIDLIAKDSATLIPGPEQCLWCDGRHLCEANAKQSLQLAQIDFEHLAEPKAELPTPNVLTRKQLAFVLDNSDRITKFLSMCREYAATVLEETDERIGDYHLEDKIGNRRLIDTDELNRIIRKNKLTIKELKRVPEPSMMSVTQIEAHLKQKKWKPERVKEFMDKITTRPKTGKQLIKSVDTAENDFSKKTKKPKTRKTRRNRRP